MFTFHYIRRHIFTGISHVLTADFESETDFLRHLNNFNIRGGDQYLYYSAQNIAPKSTFQLHTNYHRIKEPEYDYPCGINPDEPIPP